MNRYFSIPNLKRPTRTPGRLVWARLVLGILVAFVLLGSAPSGARADDCEDEGTGTSKGQGKFHIEERNGQKVYVIDKAITVCGKVPRPLVAYVLQARSINYEWETLKQDFLPKILDTVKKAPF